MHLCIVKSDENVYMVQGDHPRLTGGSLEGLSSWQPNLAMGTVTPTTSFLYDAFNSQESAAGENACIYALLYTFSCNQVNIA